MFLTHMMQLQAGLSRNCYQISILQVTLISTPLSLFICGFLFPICSVSQIFLFRLLFAWSMTWTFFNLMHFPLTMHGRKWGMCKSSTTPKRRKRKRGSVKDCYFNNYITCILWFTCEVISCPVHYTCTCINKSHAHSKLQLHLCTKTCKSVFTVIRCPFQFLVKAAEVLPKRMSLHVCPLTGESGSMGSSRKDMSFSSVNYMCHINCEIAEDS